MYTNILLCHANQHKVVQGIPKKKKTPFDDKLETWSMQYAIFYLFFWLSFYCWPRSNFCCRFHDCFGLVVVAGLVQWCCGAGVLERWLFWWRRCTLLVIAMSATAASRVQPESKQSKWYANVCKSTATKKAWVNCDFIMQQRQQTNPW